MPVNALDKAVGARIEALKAKAGLTTPQLAEKIGRSESQVFRYQSGDSRCDAETLMLLAKALGCAPSALLDGIKLK